MGTHLAQPGSCQGLRTVAGGHRPFVPFLGGQKGTSPTAALRRVQRCPRRRQICRCQAPDGGNGSFVANLRAWASSTFFKPGLGEKAEGDKKGEGEDAERADALLQAAAQSEPGREGDSTAGEPTQGFQTSWPEWQERFKHLDNLRDAYDSYHAELERAVAAEMYLHAAKLKGELQVLEREDLVGNIMEAVDTAIEREDFVEAARLRDAGGAGLVGWWVATSDSDPCGHLLRVVPDFGRYTGIMYKANELADIKGYYEAVKEPLHVRSGGLDMNPRDYQMSSMDSSGQAVMEVFLAVREDGSLQQQPVVIPPPDAQGQLPTNVEFKVFASPAEMFEDAAIDVVALGETAELAAQLEQQLIAAGASLDFVMEEAVLEGADEQADEEEEDMDVQAEDEQGEDDDVRGHALVNGEFVAISVSPNSSGSLDTQWDEGPHGHLDLEHIISNGGSVEVTSTPFDAELSGPADIPREPARIMRVDRDRFVLTVMKAEGSEEGGEEVTDSEDEETKPKGKLGGGRKRLRDLRRASGGKSSSWSKEGQTSNVFAAMAKEVEKLHNESNPDTPIHINEKRLAKQLQEVSEAIVGASSTALEGVITYNRLPTNLPKTDPFSGLYLGAFGPHGHELLRLQRVVEDGEEMVLGVKLTGDKNVPAGASSFRAKIGRKHRLPGNEYPPELGVVARYRGQGRVAAKGFSNPRWVEGELLQFTGNSLVTRGAQMGFVWVVPGERRYLILLSRIDLEEYGN